MKVTKVTYDDIKYGDCLIVGDVDFYQVDCVENDFIGVVSLVNPHNYLKLSKQSGQRMTIHRVEG